MSKPFPGSGASVLSGRIGLGPGALLREEILDPQFRYEAENLLPCYVRVEKALLAEYVRLGVLTGPEVRQIAGALESADAALLVADPDANMSDIAFAVEVYVVGQLAEPVPAWHADRSRNDLQACARLLHARFLMREAAEQMLACFHSASRLSRENLTALMPGYTHLQPAQVMTPGFYLAGLTHQLLHTLRRWSVVYDSADLCPLGAGAMTGQELDWDRDRLAALLGFRSAHPHALSAVASHVWVLEAAAECSTFGVVMSRFVTDLMAWGSGAYRFIDLPDEWSGISSAMPQKKNFPVLERIRGRTAHLMSAYVDIATAQRGTAFANSVEVSKEATAGLPGMFDHLRSVLRLLGGVLDNLVFDQARMREACDTEHLGGFSLANALTLQAGVPWRTAQVIAGEYVVAAVRAGRAPARQDPDLIGELARRHGYRVDSAARLLARSLDPELGVSGKKTSGSTHPAAVAVLLDRQAVQAAEMAAEWCGHRERDERAWQDLDGALATAGS